MANNRHFLHSDKSFNVDYAIRKVPLTTPYAKYGGSVNSRQRAHLEPIRQYMHPLSTGTNSSSAMFSNLAQGLVATGAHSFLASPINSDVYRDRRAHFSTPTTYSTDPMFMSPQYYLGGPGCPPTPTPNILGDGLTPGRWATPRRIWPSTPYTVVDTASLQQKKTDSATNLTVELEDKKPADILMDSLGLAHALGEEKRLDLQNKHGDTEVLCPEVKKAMSVCFSSLDATAVLPSSCDTLISMVLMGEVITVDLKTLDLDPHCVIELLKVTQSERANYMMAGAYYLRSGHPHSAKAVMNSMIEEFTARGLSVTQLKPAYLLLSSCELDLAKLAKGELKPQAVISEHYTAAKKWIQKVFGKPESEQLSNVDDNKENTTEKSFPKKPVRFSSGEQRESPDSSPSKKQPSSVERKLQFLRDRNNNQHRQLSQLRSAKRKLEDDLAKERNLRRKYEDKVKSVEKERYTACKMEKEALDQIKREVVLRRTAEQNLLELLRK